MYVCVFVCRVFVYVCLYIYIIHIIYVYYYISETVSRQYTRVFLSSPSADAGLILPSAATQHQRGPRARVQYVLRARMGNRVWFLNKYCRKPFSTRTRSSRCFHRVASFSCIPEPISPQPPTIYPTSTTNRTTVNPEGYILYTQNALQSCTLRGTCIHIYRYKSIHMPVCTQCCCCVCVLFAKLWRLRLWIFIRVCS